MYVVVFLPGFWVSFLDRKTNPKSQTLRKQTKNMNKNKSRSKQAKSLLCFCWQKDNTSNIPTSRNKKPKEKKAKDHKQNWQTCFEKTLHQTTPELHGQQRFCSQKNNTTQPTKTKQNKRNKRTKIKGTKKQGRFRVDWGGPRKRQTQRNRRQGRQRATSPDPKPSKKTNQKRPPPPPKKKQTKQKRKGKSEVRPKHLNSS